MRDRNDTTVGSRPALHGWAAANAESCIARPRQLTLERCLGHAQRLLGTTRQHRAAHLISCPLWTLGKPLFTFWLLVVGLLQ